MTFSVAVPDGLGGLPGVTPRTNFLFHFISILESLILCFNNLNNVDGII